MAITISCHKLRNTFTRIIRVESNDADNPRQLLTCKGTILEAFKTDTTGINFGNVSRLTGETTRKIVLQRGDGGPLSPKLTSPKSESISAELKEITPGERYEVVVKLHAPYKSQRIRAQLKFETGVAESPTGSVSIHASIKPRVAVRPRRFSVPAEPKPGWKLGVGLVWDASEPHKITGATVDDPRMEVRLEETSARQRVVLRMVDGYFPKPGTRAVTIKTDDDQSPEVRVPVVIRTASRSIRPKGAKPGSHGSKRTSKAKSARSSGSTYSSQFDMPE